MFQRLRVLLIEDEPGDADLMLLALRQSTRPVCVAFHEPTLAGAIERLGNSAAFDVALLDLGLPDSLGFDTLTRLQEAAPNLPIVIMTGLDDPALAEKALEAGAQDYLVKGESPPGTVARSIRYAIARKIADLESKAMAERLATALLAENERMEEQLSLARTMEFDLLPKRDRLDALREHLGLFIDAYFEPSFDVGGDLWGCVETEGGKFAVFIFDFSGHGVSASLNVFRLHTLLNAFGRRIVDPAATLTRLNQVLFDLLPRGQYATIFLGVIDTAGQTLTWSAGGAPPPILFSHDGGGQWLETRGKPLGISAGAKYLNRTAPFTLGSSLFLYSDAMLEARTGAGDMLGEDGLMAMVRANSGAAGINIAGLIRQFTEAVGSPLDDDLTAVSLFAIAEAPGGRADPRAGSAPSALPMMILTSTDGDAIATGLSPPYGGFLEITEAGLADVGRICFEAAKRGALSLSLSTLTAYDRRMWELLAEAAKRRFGGERDWDGLDLILVEAIGNAIVHGNLEIRSGLRESPSGLGRFTEDILDRLGNPAIAGRRVEATIAVLPDGRLEVLIADRGAGFDYARSDDRSRRQSDKHGRGLSLIKKIAYSVAFRDGGRTIVVVL
ncbi:MAG TPA: SpoIIE family protein phosphatase [Rhodospirillaceae bacterium]|nr:SpoIIE family protein phosphatase [Rhodospirillaceae bacterium]